MLLTPIGNVVLVNIIPALQFFPVDRTKQVNMLIASDVSETERRRGKPEVDKSIPCVFSGKIAGGVDEEEVSGKYSCISTDLQKSMMQIRKLRGEGFEGGPAWQEGTEEGS